jgi:carbonic anhydrase
MELTRRFFLAGAAIGATSGLRAGSSELTPQSVHRELVQGNLRFIGGQARHPHSSLSWAKKQSRDGQHPHAVILSCSDSRVVPEILFDQGIGDLFAVRVAGNVANEDEVASIEYAVHHFQTPLVVVLGHTRCGAIRAVVAGEEIPERLSHWVSPIREAYRKEKQKHPQATKDSLIDATIRANVILSMRHLAEESEMRERIRKGTLRVEGGVYHLDTGQVSWL